MSEFKKVLIGALALGILFMAFGSSNGGKKNQDSTKQNAKVEQNVKKPNYASLSKDQIEERTGAKITDFHVMKFAMAERANGNVDTQGVIEFNSESIEHKFWATFIGEKMVRLKIDENIIFDESGK